VFGPLSNGDFDWHPDKLTPAHGQVLREDAAKVQFSRNLRRKDLDSAILGEPAWDILLALFIVHNDKRRMNVGELAKVTHTPLTTTVRWVGALEERELAQRRPNPFDQRVVQVELTDKGRRAMESYFMRMREAKVFGCDKSQG
jgi:DNA-binding MarR family transcriptional regulator